MSTVWALDFVYKGHFDGIFDDGETIKKYHFQPLMGKQ